MTKAQQELIDRAAFVRSRGQDHVYVSGHDDRVADQLESEGLGTVSDAGYLRVFKINDSGLAFRTRS